MTSNCGIVGFNGPSVTGTHGNNVASIVSGHVSKWSIGTNRYTLRSGNRGFWIDGHHYLEGLTYAIAICPGSGGDGIGDGLNCIGGVGECLRNRSLGSGLVTLTGDVAISRYSPSIGGICGNYCGSRICRSDCEGIAGANRWSASLNFWCWVDRYRKIKGRSGTRSAFWRQCINNILWGIGGISKSVGKCILGRWLRTFPGNVRVIGFDCPSILSIYWDDIASSMGCRVRKRGIRTNSYGFIYNFWCWIYLNCKIERCSHTKTITRNEHINNSLRCIGSIS